MHKKEIEELIERVKNFSNKDILIIGNQQNIDKLKDFISNAQFQISNNIDDKILIIPINSKPIKIVMPMDKIQQNIFESIMGGDKGETV